MSYSPPAPVPTRRRRRWPWFAGGAVVLIILIAALASNGGGNGANTPPAQNTGAPIAGSTGAKAATSGHTVVYAVTGHGSLTDITYTTDGSTTMNQESNPALPWSKTINLSADQAIEVAQVMAQGGSDASAVTVTITVDGKLVKTASATGYGVASADYTISGF